MQLLAFLCNFWEGKEINELLSAYIHKFENIQSFINTLKDLGEKVEFKETYGLFNGDNAKKIAQTLRYIASIGKMKPDLFGAKRQLYKAAIEMLGIEKLDIENDEEKFNKWLEDNVLASKEEKKKDCNPFRNFIAKQIIENRRFLYLVRYTKPQTVRAVMSNPVVVQYVLSRLGNIRKDTKEREMTQIDKYYKRLNGGTEANHDNKIKELTKMLTGLSFDKIVDNKGKIKDAAHRPGKEESYTEKSKRLVIKSDIEKLKGLVGLYFTVAYIAVKNLVKANARYYIAFSIFDRDYALFKQKLGLSENDWKFGNFTNPFAITEHFLDNDNALRYQWNPDLSIEENKQALRKHIDDKTIRSQRHFTQEWLDIFQGNLEDAEKRNKKPKEGNLKTAKRIHPTGWLLTVARNHAEHLNVLTRLPDFIGDFYRNVKDIVKPHNLYFQLYHYIVQQLLFEDEQLKEKLQEYEKKVKQHSTPCSDLIKVTYVSLGYNLPRYKNLTVEELFEEQQ